MKLQTPEQFSTFLLKEYDVHSGLMDVDSLAGFITLICFGNLLFNEYHKEKDVSQRILLLKVGSYIYSHMHQSKYKRQLNSVLVTVQGMLINSPRSDSARKVLTKCTEKVAAFNPHHVVMGIAPDWQTMDVSDLVKWVVAHI